MDTATEYSVRNADTRLNPEEFAKLFDENWWDEFLDGTVRMSTPEAFSGRMTAEHTKRMRRCILDIIAQHGATCRDSYGYRVWVDGQQLTDLDDHFARAPEPGEDVEEWTCRAFGEKRFGIILNRGEKFSEELSAAMAHALKPLLSKIGMPTEGILFTIFIGNYDMTPLGIHKDLPGKSVMHFHLGPGSKTMYVWEDERYQTEPGERRQNNMRFAPHLDSAVARTFHEGDIYFMPENRFHLGTQDGLSIGIACWANNRSKRHFAERLIQLVKLNYLLPSEDMLKADRLAADDVSAVDSTMALFATPEIGEGSFKALLRHVYKDFRLALFSNAGFRNAPLPNAETLKISDDDSICIEEPYRIFYVRCLEQKTLALYVRGTKVILNEVGGLRTLVDALNGGHRFAFPAVLDMLGEPWTEHAARYLLALLHRHRGIRIA